MLGEGPCRRRSAHHLFRLLPARPATTAGFPGHCDPHCHLLGMQQRMEYPREVSLTNAGFPLCDRATLAKKALLERKEARWVLAMAADGCAGPGLGWGGRGTSREPWMLISQPSGC